VIVHSHMKAVVFPSWVRVALAAAASIAASPTAFAVDIRICTEFGAVDVALDERAAPLHTANFLRYTASGFYDGTVFHRVVPGSMIEGGSLDARLQRRTPGDSIANESDNGLLNQRGTIAASRSEDPDSATSQFYFNLDDNTQLDPGFGMPGYTVFGRVTAGLETIDQIARLPSRRVGDRNDMPTPLVEIQSVVTLDNAPVFGLSIERDPATATANYEMARARRDAAGTLDALNAMKRSCVALNSSQRLAEAESAIAIGQLDRARFGLERYLATATAFDPARPTAERLYASLPLTPRIRSVDALVGHCGRPIAPSVPNGRFAERATLQAIESAVLRFRQLGQLYLTCVTQRLARADLDPAERIELTERHNELVIELTAVAARFNQAVRNFQSAQ